MGKTEWKEKKAGNFNPLVNTKEKKGKETVGIYQGKKLVGDDPKDQSTIHTLDINGVMTDFWGTGQLNYLLQDVEKGTNIKIVYLGLVKADVKIKGKVVTKEVHNFQLFTE